MSRFIPPNPDLNWPIPRDAVYLIADSEQGPGGGVALKAYRCPAGKWTIGWGETDGVRPGDRCTPEQADKWLLEDVTERAAAVHRMCTVEPSENELGALVSLAYNIGLDGLKRSTVLRQHNAGNRQPAARAFSLWNKARNPQTGALEVLNGLTARRAREAALYLTPDEGLPPEPMPQAVEAESSLARSPIAVSGATTAAGGATLGAAVVADQVKEASGLLAQIKEAGAQLADVLGVPPMGLLAIALIVAGYLVIRHRQNQRSEGWA